MNNFDKIIYINLDRRKDRKKHIEKLCLTYNFEAERFSAIDIPDFGALGCYLSHLEILKNARDKNYKNLLILEDDFYFVASKSVINNTINNFFSSEFANDYNILLLSFNLKKSKKTQHKNVLKVLDAQTTSGYCIANNYYDKLISLLEENLEFLKNTREVKTYAIDKIWKLLQPEGNWYCLTPRIGKQMKSYSDIEKKIVDYKV